MKADGEQISDVARAAPSVRWLSWSWADRWHGLQLHRGTLRFVNFAVHLEVPDQIPLGLIRRRDRLSLGFVLGATPGDETALIGRVDGGK